MHLEPSCSINQQQYVYPPMRETGKTELTDQGTKQQDCASFRPSPDHLTQEHINPQPSCSTTEEDNENWVC